jgi:hypothetical protein
VLSPVAFTAVTQYQDVAFLGAVVSTKLSALALTVAIATPDVLDVPR